MQFKEMETMEKTKTGGEKQWSGSSRGKQEKYRRCYWMLAKESR